MVPSVYICVLITKLNVKKKSVNLENEKIKFHPNHLTSEYLRKCFMFGNLGILRQDS